MNGSGVARAGTPPVGVVVVGHGRLAADMVEALVSVVGQVDAVEGVACSPTDDQVAVRGRILDAIAQHDPEAAQARLREHLSGTLGQIDEICQRYPDYVAR